MHHVLRLGIRAHHSVGHVVPKAEPMKEAWAPQLVLITSLQVHAQEACEKSAMHDRTDVCISMCKCLQVHPAAVNSPDHIDAYSTTGAATSMT